MKLSKCQVGRLQVHYLGHVIGQGKLGHDENKIIAIKKLPHNFEDGDDAVEKLLAPAMNYTITAKGIVSSVSS